MAKKNFSFDTEKIKKLMAKKMPFVAMPVMAVVAIAVIAITAIAIIALPTANNSQYGVGADGFSAHVEDGGNLGVSTLVDKNTVVEALGEKAKSVENPATSKVLNYGGNRGQTVTFDFVRADGKDASVYIDVMVFKDSSSLEKANVLQATVNGGKVGEHKAYFMHALTLGHDREYRLLVIDGLKIYKFVMVQPFRNITISEVSAMAVLKTVASKAQF